MLANAHILSLGYLWFFDKLSNKLLWLFCLFVCLFVFFNENAFSSILTNELKRFASGAILSFPKKDLS